jgi:hypothetical protein
VRCQEKFCAAQATLRIETFIAKKSLGLCVKWAGVVSQKSTSKSNVILSERSESKDLRLLFSLSF